MDLTQEQLCELRIAISRLEPLPVVSINPQMLILRMPDGSLLRILRENIGQMPAELTDAT